MPITSSRIAPSMRPCVDDGMSSEVASLGKMNTIRLIVNAPPTFANHAATAKKRGDAEVDGWIFAPDAGGFTTAVSAARAPMISGAIILWTNGDEARASGF